VFRHQHGPLWFQIQWRQIRPHVISVSSFAPACTAENATFNHRWAHRSPHSGPSAARSSLWRQVSSDFTLCLRVFTVCRKTASLARAQGKRFVQGVQEWIVSRWGQAPFRRTAPKRSPFIRPTHELVPDSLLKMCATAVSAVPKFANGLVSRTADTAVAHGTELFNRLLTPTFPKWGGIVGGSPSAMPPG